MTEQGCSLWQSLEKSRLCFFLCLRNDTSYWADEVYDDEFSSVTFVTIMIVLVDYFLDYRYNRFIK